jgi:hypothetical protein
MSRVWLPIRPPLRWFRALAAVPRETLPVPAALPIPDWHLFAARHCGAFPWPRGDCHVVGVFS